MGKTCLYTIGAVLMLSLTPVLSQDNFGIVEPEPENIYPIEFTSAQVTCVAFDSSGVKTPEKILFMRKNRFAFYTNVTANGNLYFTSRIQEINNKGGQKLKKLFVTMHFRNVTFEYDSSNSALGRYECHAFAVGDSTEKKHGFTVNVIRRGEIPRVFVTESRHLKDLKDGDEVIITCNATQESLSLANTQLKTVSWLKDGSRVQSVRCPAPNALEPLLVTVGGNYTCVLEVLLRRITAYNVSAYTVIRYSPRPPLCPAETSDGVSWPITSGSRRDLQPCPDGRIGAASRLCSTEGTWKRPDLTGCRSAEFNMLYEAVTNLRKRVHSSEYSGGGINICRAANLSS